MQRHSSKESADAASPSHLRSDFKGDAKLVTHGDKCRWVSRVLKMSTLSKTNGGLELKLLERRNSYIRNYDRNSREYPWKQSSWQRVLFLSRCVSCPTHMQVNNRSNTVNNNMRRREHPQATSVGMSMLSFSWNNHLLWKCDNCKF